MKRFLGIKRSVCFVFLIVLLASCSLKTEVAILGKWKEIDGSETMEFFKDGSLKIVDKGTSVEGNYKFLADSRLGIQAEGVGTLAVPVIFSVSISKNELTLTDPKGDVSRYRRLE